MPSEVAVIVAVPHPMPRISPVDETVATDGSELVQVTVRSVISVPVASVRVAVNCRVCPAIKTTRGGLTTTDASGISVTVISPVPVTPPDVAVIVADPRAIPVTNPVSDTVAEDWFELDQVTVIPESTLPVESRRVAISC